jgi:hypothetical protein
MATVITFDRPGFTAELLETGGQIVCVLATAAATDTVIQARVRRMMRGQGIDCRMCLGCPVGQAE